MVNRVKRNCTDDSELVRAKSEYSYYPSRASYNISGIEKCITSFTPTYHPVISEIHKIILKKNFRSAVDSSEQLKEILTLDTIKLSSRRDRDLKEMLAPSVPFAHRKDKQLHFFS